MAVSVTSASLTVFTAVVIVYSSLIYLGLAWSFRKGSVWCAVSLSLLASAVPMGVLGTVMEHRTLWDIFDPSRAYWAFSPGNLVFHPLTTVVLALGWRHLGQPKPGEKYAGPWTMLACGLFGLACGIWFHIKESAVYPLAMLFTPTKIFHDLGPYVMLPAAFAYGAVRLFVNPEGRKYLVLALGSVGGWYLLGVLDEMFHHAKLGDMHLDSYQW